MEIVFEQQQIYFNLFYFSAFAFLAITVLFLGKRQGYSWSSLLLFLGTIAFSTILGSRLITIPIEVWPELLFRSETPFLNRSAIGGITLGVIGLIVAQKALKLSNRFVLHFAWMIPVALAIQKIGCFVNGCCFGKVCTNLIGIRYPQNTLAHHAHWKLGHIEDPSMLSSMIYPVQLMEVMGFVLVAILVWRLRRRLKKHWPLIWLSLALVFSIHFIGEFFKDPYGSQFGIETYWGLRSIQWVILSLTLFSLALFGLTERNYHLFDRISVRLNKPWLFLIVSTLTIALHGVFMTFEWTVMWFTLLPALGLLCFKYIVSQNKIQKWAWAAMTLIIPMIVIAQTVGSVNDKMDKFHEVRVGAETKGTFYNLLLFNPETTSTSGVCGTFTNTTYDEEAYKSEFSSYGGGYSWVQRNKFQSMRLNVDAYFGNVDTEGVLSGNSFSDSYWAVSPFFQYDRRWWGLGLGMHVGKLYISKDDRITSENFEDLIEDRAILPSFYARLGPRKYFDVAYHYGNLFPSPFPKNYSYVSFGTGLLQDYDYSLRYGISTGGNFLSAEGILQDQFGFKVMYIFNNEEDPYPGTDGNNSQWVFNVYYRFGQK